MTHENTSALEVDVATVARWRDEGKPFLLLDVREDDEFGVANIDGAMLVPMSQLRDRFDELEPYRDQHIVVHCHHGARSLQVTEALRDAGFTQVQNMAGGIDAWSTSIDSNIPRY